LEIFKKEGAGELPHMTQFE